MRSFCSRVFRFLPVYYSFCAEQCQFCRNILRPRRIEYPQNPRKGGIHLSAQGRIQTHVFTSSANLPVPGASVAVTDTGADGRETLLSFQLTNSSGNTRPTDVDTPPAADSQSPDQPVGFTSLRVAVDMPGFERVIVTNVQVFPGVTTIQDVQLLPTEDLPGDWGTPIEFDLPSQSL